MKASLINTDDTMREILYNNDVTRIKENLKKLIKK